MNEQCEQGKHNLEGPFYLAKSDYSTDLHRDVYNVTAKAVWTCDNCGLVTCKLPVDSVAMVELDSNTPIRLKDLVPDGD